MSDIAIKVENISKRYKIGARKHFHDTLRDHLVEGVKSFFTGNGRHAQHASDTTSRSAYIWALKDISFEVKPGEVVGVIGRNGAGKSTLLKILSRITQPDEGRAEIHGRVGSLLEVGTGFHPELTGRENIYLNGAVLGMHKAEIARKFDEIVAFAEIEKFIDTPVKRYSSGMYVRLAFAVAAHLETEILLADEVLAVGDVEFQKKCLGKMGEVAKQGRTVLFVSHNMGTVLNLCPRVMLFRFGELLHDGPADSAIRDYLTNITSNSEQAFDDHSERAGNGTVRIVGARVLNEMNQPSSHLISGRPASFEFQYKNFTEERRKASISFGIYNQFSIAVSTFDSSLNHELVERLGIGGVLVCQIPELPLPLGQYHVTVKLEVNGELADFIPDALAFAVDSSNFFTSGRTPQVQFCTCLVHHSWSQQEEAEIQLEARREL